LAMDTMQTALLGMIFLTVAASVLAGSWLLQRRARLRERMSLAAGTPTAQAASTSVDALQQAPAQRLVEPVARLAAPGDEQAVSRLRARFLHAGWRARAAPLYFLALKTVLALSLPLAGWLVITLGGLRLSATTTLLVLVLCASVGTYLPNAVLTAVARARQRDLFEAFPDAIDLMIVCLESGLSLDLAIQRAGREMGLRSPALAEELGLVETELRIGASRERALRHLALRTGVEEIESFVAALLQADRFGVSIAESMRVHAEDLRVRRQNRAEEEAAKVPTKLLFPLILTIFPALFLVLVGPAALGLARQVLPALGGAGAG